MFGMNEQFIVNSLHLVRLNFFESVQKLIPIFENNRRFEIGPPVFGSDKINLYCTL